MSRLWLIISVAITLAGCSATPNKIWGGGANYDYEKTVEVLPDSPNHKLVSCRISGLSNRDQISGVGLIIDGDCNLKVGIEQMSAQQAALMMSILGQAIGNLPAEALKSMLSPVP